MAVDNKDEAELKENLENQESSEAAAAQENQPEAESTEEVNAQSGDAATQTQEEALAEKLKDLQDKHLRLSAEFDNYRKRTLKEKTELIKSAGESVLSNILPVIDDMERAMESVNKANDIEALREGMNLIYNKFVSFINQNGVKEIESKDQAFDTDLHEAVAKIPAPTEDMKGKVVDVLQKGYMLHDKVIRHTKVVVGE